MLCLTAGNAFASKVDTVLTFSPSMKKNIKAVVITPDTYPKADKMPVLYLLHGYSGKYDNWTKHMPNINYLADQYHLHHIHGFPVGNAHSLNIAGFYP